jgi:hypothetical protein
MRKWEHQRRRGQIPPGEEACTIGAVGSVTEQRRRRTPLTPHTHTSCLLALSCVHRSKATALSVAHSWAADCLLHDHQTLVNMRVCPTVPWSWQHHQKLPSLCLRFSSLHFGVRSTSQESEFHVGLKINTPIERGSRRISGGSIWSQCQQTTSPSLYLQSPAPPISLNSDPMLRSMAPQLQRLLHILWC